MKVYFNYDPLLIALLPAIWIKRLENEDTPSGVKGFVIILSFLVWGVGLHFGPAGNGNRNGNNNGTDGNGS